MQRTTTLFSTFPPDELFLNLTTKLREERQDYEIREPTWKIFFTVKKSLYAAERAMHNEQVSIQVEILRVRGQAKYAVEFKRKGGSERLFYGKVKEYIEHMWICNDTTLQVEESN